MKLSDEAVEKAARAIAREDDCPEDVDINFMWQHHVKEARAALEAALPCLVGEGWVVVPREPTKAMVQAGADEVGYPDHGGEDSQRAAAFSYRAMLAAAPDFRAVPEEGR